MYIMPGCIVEESNIKVTDSFPYFTATAITEINGVKVNLIGKFWCADKDEKIITAKKRFEKNPHKYYDFF